MGQRYMSGKKLHISIIIPTFNRENILQLNLETIMKWDVPQLKEVIVVDDQSTDNTFEVVKHYSNKFPKIKYIIGLGKGQMLAKQKGIEISSGNIICILDDDTIPVNNWIEPIVKRFKQGADIVQTKLITELVEKGNSKKAAILCWNMWHIKNWNSNIPQEVPFTQEAGVFFKKSIIEEIDYRDPNLIKSGWGESTSFALRAKQKGYISIFEPSAVLIHKHIKTGGSPERYGNQKYFTRTSPEDKYYNTIYLQRRFKPYFLPFSLLFWVLELFFISIIRKKPMSIIPGLKGIISALGKKII